MKQAVLGAGKEPFLLSRRRCIQAGLAGVMLSALKARADGPSVLSPAGSYVGARLLLRVDNQGMPVLGPDTFGPMTLFVFPVAVAATPFDFYVADAGLSALLRFDAALDAMAIVPGVRVSQQTRITALPDGSVVVVEGRLGVPRRYSRTGRLLQNFNPQNTGSRFDDVVADASGRYFGLDRVQRRIEEIHPLGRSGIIIPEDLLPKLPSAIALDDQTLYAAGQDCRCVVAIDLFRRDRQILVEDLGQATALAAGEGWLVVADNFERTLRVYRRGVLVGDPMYQSLGLMNPQGFAIARSTLYVADAGSRRVAMFRLRP